LRLIKLVWYVDSAGKESSFEEGVRNFKDFCELAVSTTSISIKDIVNLLIVVFIDN
jgi:hypothetical protein